jgi:hypothetical protein
MGQELELNSAFEIDTQTNQPFDTLTSPTV